MPLSEPPAPWARIQVFGNCDGIPTLNQFYYFTSETDPFQADFADIFIQDWFTLVGEAWLAAVSNDWTMGSVYCTLLDTIHRFEAADSIAEPGTDTGPALPAQDVAIIRWMVPAVGIARKAPGRTNISGVREGVVEGELIDNDELSKLELLATKLMGPVSTVSGDFLLKVYSPTHNVLLLPGDYFVVPTIKVLRNRRGIS